AAVDLLGRIALHVEEVDAQVVHEPGVLRLHLGRRVDHRAVGPGPGDLVGGGQVVAGQEVEDDLAAVLGQFGIGPGGIDAGGGDDAGQQRRFGQRQFPGRLAEVGLAGRLDAERRLAEVDGVEVAGQDL